MAQPEQQARDDLDKLLTVAGWRVFDIDQINVYPML